MKAILGNALLILCLTPAVCFDALAESERSGQGALFTFAVKLWKEAAR